MMFPAELAVLRARKYLDDFTRLSSGTKAFLQ